MSAVKSARGVPDCCCAAMSRVLAAATFFGLFACCGCSALHRKPIAENMVASRQIALQGLNAKHLGNWTQAEASFRSALEVCPDHDRAHAGYAEALWQRGEWELALNHMQEAVRLSGGEPDLLVQLGKMHLDKGEYAAARHRIDQALAVRRDLPAAWKLRGDILRENGEIDEALGCYHRVLQLEVDHLDTQLAIADLYLAQNRAQRSLATLERAAERYVASQPPAQIGWRKGIAQKALGRYQDAIASFQAARGAVSQSEWAIALSEVQMLAGDLSAARLTLSESALTESAFSETAPVGTLGERIAQLAGEIDRRQQKLAANASPLLR